VAGQTKARGLGCVSVPVGYSSITIAPAGAPCAGGNGFAVVASRCFGSFSTLRRMASARVSTSSRATVFGKAIMVPMLAR
jgi:hypothetical protein